MILVPYRSHKKPESFPYATVAILLINVVVFAFTSEDLLRIREKAVDAFALSHHTILAQPWRLITAMFLHGNLTHLIGNMLLFGVFGPAAEGRLRTFRFTLLYFLAGIIGWIFHDLVVGFGAPERFALGASGAIMGVIGMYLYMFPHTKVKVFFLGAFRPKILQWKSYWIIGFYLFFDLWAGAIQSHDGVAHLCHLAGIAVGWIGCLLMGAARDTQEDTRVEELIAASGGNLYTLDVAELGYAYEACPNSAELALAYCIRLSRDGARRKAVQVMTERETQLTESDAPQELAYIILGLHDHDGNPPVWLMLRTALRLADEDPGIAEALLWRVLRSRPRPTGDVLEKALMRLASLLEAKDKQREEAAALYLTVLQQFPISDSTIIARLRLKEIGMPQTIAFSLEEGKMIKHERPKTLPQEPVPA